MTFPNDLGKQIIQVSGSSKHIHTSMRVPFWSMHHSGRAHGGSVPSGSSPASLSKRATTPWGGTLCIVMLRTTVPLSVWVHKSWISVNETVGERNRYDIRGQSTVFQHESKGIRLGWRTCRQGRQDHWSEEYDKRVSRSVVRHASYQHEDGPILRLTAPVFCRSSIIVLPVGLS